MILIDTMIYMFIDIKIENMLDYKKGVNVTAIVTEKRLQHVIQAQFLIIEIKREFSLIKSYKAMCFSLFLNSTKRKCAGAQRYSKRL